MKRYMVLLIMFVMMTTPALIFAKGQIVSQGDKGNTSSQTYDSQEGCK